MELIRQTLPTANLVFYELDLASFDSIRKFADTVIKGKYCVSGYVKTVFYHHILNK